MKARRHHRRALAALTISIAALVPILPFAGGAAAAETTGTLPAGGVLTSEQRLETLAAKTFLVMQSDGNLVQYAAGSAHTSETTERYVPVFSSATAGNPGASAVMQADGNLVVYSSAGRPLWWSGTAGTRADRLVLQEDYNLVLYSARGPVWATGGPKPPSSLRGPGWFSALRSDSGRFTLTVYPDGMWLVDTAVNPGYGGTPIWSARCTDTDPTCLRVTIQGDGNMVMHRHSGKLPPPWTSGTTGPDGVVVLQDDGNLVLYGPEVPRWWSGTSTRTAQPYPHDFCC